MPATAAEQRQGLADLTTLARRDLGLLWARLAGIDDAVAVRDALAELLPVIGEQWGAAAAALAADWYDELRDASRARGRFRATPTTDVDPKRWESLAGWGVGPLFGAEPDRAAALTLLEGGLQRTVADRHRLTIVENAVRDPEARGWTRHGSGTSCQFCLMLIDRGSVYTDATADFPAHDHCGCSAEPAWR